MGIKRSLKVNGRAIDDSSTTTYAAYSDRAVSTEWDADEDNSQQVASAPLNLPARCILCFAFFAF
jgi:hypothetical protein